MLAPRIIPTLLLHNGRLTKTIRFELQGEGLRRDVGDPLKQAMIYDAQNADEILLLDFRASEEGRGTDQLLHWVELLSNEISIPLTAGGGIRTVGDARRLIRGGCEKVVIGNQAMPTPDLVKECAEVFGSQAIVVAVDALRCHHGWLGRTGVPYTRPYYGGMQDFKAGHLQSAVALAIELGAGEILLNSIDNDGIMDGYDLKLVRSVAEYVSVPVTAVGGCGTPQDVVDVIKAGASGAGIGSMFCFTDSSPVKVRSHLERSGIPVRS